MSDDLFIDDFADFEQSSSAHSTPSAVIAADGGEVERRRRFLDIDDDTLAAVAAGSKKVLSADLDQIVDDFYNHLQKFPETDAFVRGRVEQLKKTQSSYWLELLEPTLDANYVERRQTVGRVHHRIGLEPEWYLGAFSLFAQRAMEAFEKDGSAEAWEQMRALMKVIFFDVGLTIDVYIESLMSELRAREAAIRELSAPVIEVWDEILVLPLVGTMDTARSREVTELLLPEVAQKRARVVIIDVTGLPTMDTSTADHLFKMVRAIELLGASAVITGIRPAIAQTVVSLGIDTSGLRTSARLVDGLRLALQMTGQAVELEGK